MRLFRSSMQAVAVFRSPRAGDQHRQQALKFRTPSHLPRPLRPAGRRLAVVSAVAILGVTASACSSSTPSTGNSSGTATLTGAQLVAAANKEGTVVWYTPNDPSVVKPLVALFNKTYPKIHVQWSVSFDAQTAQRVMTEQRAKSYTVDIATLGSLYTGELITAGVVAPYEIPTAQAPPSGVDILPGHNGIAYLETDIIAYNPTALKAHHLPVPTSFQDLTQPRWKGKFAIVVSGAQDTYQALEANIGHKEALNLMKTLGSNGPKLIADPGQATTEVQAGTLLVALFAAGDDSATAHAKTPTQYNFINPNPLPTTVSLINLIKNAPHPAAAKVFLDWYESKVGQQAVATITNHVSMRNDVRNNPEIWNTNVHPAFAPLQETPAQYNALITQVTAALKAP
jgi:iron(III) transport system substrate-binding protein